MNDLYFIAEMSSNHLGDFERAKDIIRCAASAGANAIKLQTYKPEHLTIDCDSELFKVQGGLWKGRKLFDLYKEAQTPWEWHELLKKFAEDHGLDFIGTPFHVEAVEFLESIGCELYKVSNLSIDDLELMRAVAKTGKETFISFDPETDSQRLERAMYGFADCQANVLLTSNDYPCDLIDSPHDKFDVLEKIPCFERVKAFGLSDHCNDALAPLIACTEGATIFEKHFTIGKTDCGHDEEFSVTPNEFRNLVDILGVVKGEMALIEAGKPTPPSNVVGWDSALLEFLRRMSDRIANLMDTIKVNAGMKNRAKQWYGLTLYAVEDIKSGELLTDENVRMIRADAQGLSPSMLNKVLGKKAHRPLARGTPIREGDYD